jgi:protein-S-isoprenylcysteine O-methyltransferase Ste14
VIVVVVILLIRLGAFRGHGLDSNPWRAGTAVALSWWWLTAVLLAGVYFLYGATVEERCLTEQFPDNYPTYKRSTKMLVPLIF